MTCASIQSKIPLTCESRCVGAISYGNFDVVVDAVARRSGSWANANDCASESRIRRVDIDGGTSSAVLSHVTMSGSSSKFGGSHCRSSSSSAGMNKLLGSILAEGGGAAESTVSDFSRVGGSRSRRDMRAGGGMFVGARLDGRALASVLSAATAVVGAGLAGGRDPGRTERSRAGRPVVGIFDEPLVIRVNSARSPLSS